MKPIHIIGGGLAGLTLGIALRKRDVPVTVTEAGDYPRHRVCGEFISGDGIQVLRRFDLESTLVNAGARPASNACFAVEDRLTPPKLLPEKALCISRFRLDALLSEEFVKLGGTLQTRTRAPQPHRTDGVVFATGRRAQPVDGNGLRWFGLKVHARGARLAADLEMHIDTDSYVGLCRLADDMVNVCGLFRRRAGEGGADLATLRGKNGSLLFDRLRDATVDESTFCSVAGLDLTPQLIDSAFCRIGDTLTMIPPITGNGMSMAFESASIAAEPLARFAGEDISWAEARETVARELTSVFAARLRWSRRFHHAIFNERGREIFGALLGCGWAWRAAFKLTRH